VSDAERPSDAVLGRRLGEYRTSAAGYASVAAIMTGSIAVATGFFAVAWGADELGGRIVLSTLGLICLLPALLGAYGLTRGRHNRLLLYENGMVVHHAGNVRWAMWDEVESYTDGLFLEVTTTNGATIQFGMSGLRGAEEITSILRNEVVVRRTVPSLLALLHAGQTVELEGLSAADALPAPSSSRTYVSSFTLDEASITPDESGRPIPWGAVTEWGESEGRAGGGRSPAKLQYVFLTSSSGGFRTLFERSSDRHTWLALCEELGAAARRTA
jgi:hypothetical protein